ncbi:MULTISPECIES: hypothetical protein [Helicobacter]|uniref:hypothetical protein n=1 Tax=Helicobacter TaxID=209 RepID=UPI002619360E|nr:hypothetical protein [Helicobacter sp. UBA3407]
MCQFGILLPKQNQEFWESCRENTIEIHPTKYPIKIDWDGIQKICKEQGVVLKFFMDSDKKQKVMTKMILNPKGNSNPFQSFIQPMRTTLRGQALPFCLY